MKLDPVENASALRWLLTAGVIAVCFAFTLYKVDTVWGARYKGNETTYNEQLRQLRLAQTGFSGSVDVRQTLSSNPAPGKSAE